MDLEILNVRAKVTEWKSTKACEMDVKRVKLRMDAIEY